MQIFLFWLGRLPLFPLQILEHSVSETIESSNENECETNLEEYTTESNSARTVFNQDWLNDLTRDLNLSKYAAELFRSWLVSKTKCLEPI